MKFEVIIVILFLVLVLPTISATQDSLGPRQAGTCINLPQTCASCTYENITGIEYPNNSYVLIEQPMTKNGIYYNYTYCFPDLIGDYWIYGHDDETGIDEEWEYKVSITYNGEKVGLSNTILPFVFLFLAALLLIIGFTFNGEHWILRTFFTFASVGMGLLCVNSAKIISNESSNLGSMGTAGITIMITILAIFFIYMFVYAFIEIIKVIKDKKGVRWNYN